MKPARLRVVKTARPPQAPILRGVQLAYRPGEANRCPGCGRSHWHVGRSSAECAFCAFPLPIVEEGNSRGSIASLLESGR